MPLAAIAAVATIGSAVVGANAQKKAAKSAAAASDRANAENNALQREIYGKNEGYLKPYISQGQTAAGQINNLLATNPYAASTGATFQADPGYQFRFNEGMRGVQQANAATNTRLSGSAQKALLGYGQGMASQQYGDWWNRDQAQLANNNNRIGNYLNDLSGTRGAGLSAGSALAGVGTNYAGQVGQNNWDAAQVQGNAALVSANATNGMLNSIGQVGGNLLGQYMQSRSSYQTPTAPAAAPYDPLRAGGFY
jgi:hypothetical protein